MARPREFNETTALRQAMHVFWHKGFDGTSMEDLTAGMGLSRSSLYETFGGKDALFLAALESYARHVGEQRDAVLAAGPTARDALRRFVLGLVVFLLDDAHPPGCFFTNTATALGALDERVQALVRRGNEEQTAAFERCLTAGRGRGELGPDKDPHALALFFNSLVRGMTVQARVSRDKKLLEDIARVGLSVLD